MTSAGHNADRDLAAEFDGCLATASRILDRAVASAFDERLRPMGIRSTQVTMLATIAGAEPPVVAADLLGPMRIDQTTISRNLARLGEMGLIDQVPGADGRAMELRLTAKGRRVLRASIPAWQSAQSAVAEVLGDRLSDAVRRAASRVADQGV